MKICSKCKKSKIRNKTSSYCKGCHNDYQKAYYKKNPRSIDESSKRRKKEIRDLIILKKDVPCKDCEEKYPYYVMDFDHRPDEEKKFNLSEAARHHRSIKSVLEEILKCDVVCSNCHRKRTFKRCNTRVV